MTKKQVTVKELVDILSEFDDEMIVEFEFNKERCPLTEHFTEEGKVVFREKYRNIKHHIDGRWFLDHTSKKGFWLEDKATGRKYHMGDSSNIGKIRDLLNEYDNQLTGGKTYVPRRVLL